LRRSYLHGARGARHGRICAERAATVQPRLHASHQRGRLSGRSRIVRLYASRNGECQVPGVHAAAGNRVVRSFPALVLSWGRWVFLEGTPRENRGGQCKLKTDLEVMRWLSFREFASGSTPRFMIRSRSNRKNSSAKRRVLER